MVDQLRFASVFDLVRCICRLAGQPRRPRAFLENHGRAVVDVAETMPWFDATA